MTTKMVTKGAYPSDVHCPRDSSARLKASSIVTSRSQRRGFVIVHVMSTTVSATRIVSNGVITSNAVTLARRMLGVDKSLLILQVLAKSAENAKVKPTEVNHGEIMQATSQTRVLAISSSILKGMMANPMIKVPKHKRSKKMGCDARTTRSFLLTMVQPANARDMSRMSEDSAMPRTRSALPT